MKKLIAILLVFSFCTSFSTPIFAETFTNFESVDTYYDGQFADVTKENWYNENVKSAYESGIMQGVSSKTFNPEGSLTYIQTIVMACRIHSIYNNIDFNFSSGSPHWYSPYLDYANLHNIMVVDERYYNLSVDRASFAVILGSSLPDSALPAINSVEDGSIRDIGLNETCYPHIYRLYRAGILVGNDKYGTFYPGSTITRGAAAAIVSRMVKPSLRKSITLTKRVTPIVPLEKLANLKHIRQNTTDAEMRAAYNVALEIVTPLQDLPQSDQLYGIATELRRRFNPDNYTMTEKHYDDPYGYLVLGIGSCAGCTRATGLCLNMLGISYEHVNENQYSHQWARANIGDEHWICDAFGLYCGIEPAPYKHPYLN